MPRMTTDIEKKLDASILYIKSRVSLQPTIGIILGSGLGHFSGPFRSIASVNIADIPHYPPTTVVGHAGNLLFSELHGVGILAFRGRIHFYESGTLSQVLYPIHIAKRLGINTLLLTNAAGGINSTFQPGDFMLIKDQINLTFAKYPSAGVTGALVHPPLYDEELRLLIQRTASKLKIRMREGTYCGLRGPSYETASEIKMLKNMGADAVGMSTVNEVSLANALGMRVAGISCITNLSTGISKAKLSHSEVTVVANTVKSKFSKLVGSVIAEVLLNE